MSLTVKNWQLKQLWHLYQDRELDMSPEYQRREAWTAKSMVLIDSIARRIPINAITLYKTNESGPLVYEVIDGKQRLTALMQFQKDELTPLAEALKDLSEEEELEGKELAEKIMDKKWSDLDAGTRSAFLDYEVPIYVVEGSRASAVRAFRRMNADPYALTPQEIRNAIFRNSEFLNATRRLSETVDRLATGTDHFLVEWGVISSRQWLRMQDLQFLSELLCLSIAGPQEARRTLDTTYEEYSSPRGNKQTALKKAVAHTAKALEAAQKILGNSLKPHSLSSENDVYALIGALFRRGIPSTPQLADKDAAEDLRETLSLFGNEVLLCQEAIKANEEDQIRAFAKEVKDYATTLLGGQINSAKRRETRIDILAGLFNDRIAPIDPRKPSELQRRLVWARSPDKKCGRCGKRVDWKQYDCGHVNAKAFGGRAVVSNLRVEHLTCNRSAKQK